MNTVGIVGGIGPESTVEYYRKIVTTYFERDASGNYPRVIINSINMKQMLDLIGSQRFDELTDYLVLELAKLADAGADFGVLASNTPHIVFEKVNKSSPLPLISIVEATCKKARDMGLQRVGLTGTKFTMQGGFYNKVFSQHGIEVITPDEAGQSYVHDKYMNELVNGIILDETRSGLLGIINKLIHDHDIEGLILGGTELPLILKTDDVPGIHVLDTTEIHVGSVLNLLE